MRTTHDVMLIATFAITTDICFKYATVVELEDTMDLKSIADNSIRVRVPSVAPFLSKLQEVKFRGY